MRDYGRIYSTFWTSTDIQELSDDGKLLALYLLSGPHGTLAGVCRLPDGYVCEDLKWTPQRVAKGFAELFRKGFVNRCETTNWVWIRKFLVWNRPENPNQWKAARKLASQVPSSCAWKAEFIGVFDAIEAGNPPEELNGYPNRSETVPKPLPTQEQEQEQEQEQKGSTREPPPSDLDAKAWEAWVGYRASIRKPLRPVSHRAAMRQLAAFGQRQMAVVEQSIANGWQGLFDVKATPTKPKADPYARAI